MLHHYSILLQRIRILKKALRNPVFFYGLRFCCNTGVLQEDVHRLPKYSWKVLININAKFCLIAEYYVLEDYSRSLDFNVYSTEVGAENGEKKYSFLHCNKNRIKFWN